jgi:transcriptional regulator with XRE-family HTH domain
MALSNRITRSEEGMRVWQQERAIFEVTELICELMDSENVTRTELANRLNKTKGYISQLLDGQTNMTVRTISDVFTALGRALHVFDGPMELSAPRHSFRFAPTSCWEGTSRAWKPAFHFTTTAAE